MKSELSKEFWLKVKLLLTDTPIEPVKELLAVEVELVEKAPLVTVVLGLGEKKPATEAGLLLKPATPMLALGVTLPVPHTAGISKKLIGTFLELRTTLIKILSLLYSSIISR